MTDVYCARCDQFDDSRTGYYATPEAAEAAFWQENHFSAEEAKRARVYTQKRAVDAELIADANWLASRGSPSPAMGIAATV